MANVLTVPASGAIIFDNQTAGSSTISPLSTSPRLQYDNAGGINITSYTTASSALNRFTVDGATGRLYSVTDALTGTIFSVNDVSGLPIIEVNSNATDIVKIGTYATNALVVNDAKVGIGTATPVENLTVVGNISSTGRHTLSSVRVVNGSYIGELYVASNGVTSLNSASNNLYFLIGGTLAAYVASGAIGVATNAKFVLGNNGEADLTYNNVNLLINPRTAGSGHTLFTAGNVCIGNATPNEKLTVVGNISATGSVRSASLTATGNATVSTLNATTSVKATNYFSAAGNLGATGSFTSQEGSIITVENGLITDIAVP
jgi:hypothetical protein